MILASMQELSVPMLPDLLVTLVVATSYIAYIVFVTWNIRRKRRATDLRGSIRKLLWTGLWLGYIFKATRGTYTHNVFHVLTVTCLLGLFSLTLNTSKPRTLFENRAVSFLMFCYLAYAIQSVFSCSDKLYVVQAWIKLTLVWLTIYRCVSFSKSKKEFLSDVFCGAPFLCLLVTIIVVVFSLLWPDLSISNNKGIIGPFINGVYLSHVLAVLLIGLYFRNYLMKKDLKSNRNFVVCRLTTFTALVLTLGRSGILLGSVFALLASILYERKWIPSLLLILGAASAAMLIIPKDALLERLEARDRGRWDLLEEQVSEAKGQLLFGHGFGASKRINFAAHRKWEQWHTSHNFVLSLVYDLGFFGLLLAFLLCFAVIISYVQAAFYYREKESLLYLLAWFGCIAVAQVENAFWNPNIVIEILVISLMCMATRTEGTLPRGRAKMWSACPWLPKKSVL